LIALDLFADSIYRIKIMRNAVKKAGTSYGLNLFVVIDRVSGKKFLIEKTRTLELRNKIPKSQNGSVMSVIAINHVTKEYRLGQMKSLKKQVFEIVVV